MSVEASAVSFMRRIWMGVSNGKITNVNGILPSGVAHYILNKKRNDLSTIEERYKVNIQIESDPQMPPGDGKLDFVTT